MKIENGVLYRVYNKDINKDGSFIIPDGVTTVCGSAFRDCLALTSVTIPASVKRIGPQAFRDCSNLTSVIVHDGVAYIGEYAFYGCSALTSISIPESIRWIGFCSFENCTGLTSIIIGNGITRIQWGVFWGCSSLKSVTLPNSVTSIEDYAFFNCTSLTFIVIPESVTSIGNEAFYGCHGLTSITIPKGVTYIGHGAFAFTQLKSKPNNYKAFWLTGTDKLVCRDTTYTIGKKSTVKGKLKLCQNGIHYCTNIYDIFNYYAGEYGEDFVIGICNVSDVSVSTRGDSKRCARWIIPTKILSREEVIGIMNGEDEGIVV